MNDEERKAIVDEIMAEVMPPPLEAWQFTRKDFQDQTGLTMAKARHLLDRMVLEGKLKVEQRLIDGHWSNVFWRPGDERSGLDN